MKESLFNGDLSEAFEYPSRSFEDRINLVADSLTRLALGSLLFFSLSTDSPFKSPSTKYNGTS